MKLVFIYISDIWQEISDGFTIHWKTTMIQKLNKNNNSLEKCQIENRTNNSSSVCCTLDGVMCDALITILLTFCQSCKHNVLVASWPQYSLSQYISIKLHGSKLGGLVIVVDILYMHSVPWLRLIPDSQVTFTYL